MEQDSITEWLGRLNHGEAEAAQKLWERYAENLLDLAQRRLSDVPRRAADEEDIAQSVFASVCRAAANGRFSELKTRSELWWLVLSLTKQKVANYVRHETAQKRGNGRVKTECELPGGIPNGKPFTLDMIVSERPSADFIVSMQEEYEHLLDTLRDDRLRDIATMRIEGYSIAEIATRLGIGVRAVERKLQLIRSKWSRQLGNP
jgi:DNA-directed RNA polymerase specialized sigma24 family protein